MSKDLEQIKAYVLEQTESMSDNARVELLDALAWWASDEAGSLNFDSADAELFDEQRCAGVKGQNTQAVKHNFSANCRAIENRLNNHLNTVKNE